MSFGGRDENSEDGRPNKFLYSGSVKPRSDPWGSSNDDDGEFDFEPQQNVKKLGGCSPGLDLNDVWSIRKNVQVSEPIKKGTALQTSSKSYYSRHGGLGGTGEIEGSILGQKGDELSRNDHKSWSVSRSSYSYSDQATVSGNQFSQHSNEFDDLLERNSTSSKESDDTVQRKNLLNSKLRMAGAPQITSREMSARTRRAHKMNQAHLKSMGLGQHTPGNASYIRTTENDGKVKWKEKDDWS